MLLFKRTIILICVAASFPVAAHSQPELSINEEKIHEFGAVVSYEEGKQIYFPHIIVTYKGSVIEPGHEKFSSEVFEVVSGENTKTITIPPLAILGGTIFRFGVSFYELDTLKSRTFTVKKPGFWRSFGSIF